MKKCVVGVPWGQHSIMLSPRFSSFIQRTQQGKTCWPRGHRKRNSRNRTKTWTNRRPMREICYEVISWMFILHSVEPKTENLPAADWFLRNVGSRSCAILQNNIKKKKIWKISLTKKKNVIKTHEKLMKKMSKQCEKIKNMWKKMKHVKIWKKSNKM